MSVLRLHSQILGSGGWRNSRGDLKNIDHAGGILKEIGPMGVGSESILYHTSPVLHKIGNLHHLFIAIPSNTLM